MGSFEIRDEFRLNNEKFKIISGAVHYFRVVPEYWKDRLEKLKALGCNTVETYVAWNVHEPGKGEFDFSGAKDIGSFLKTAAELGLYAIVRPSPYICAEWEFGGLPGWLLAEDGMRVRSSSGPFLSHVSAYYRELFKILSPLQITKGGPIIMFQIENEYGAYGNDTDYLEKLRDMMIENGVDVPMITSDGPWDDYLECGKVPGILQSANFGSKAKEQFAVLRKKIGDNKPLMCMEFWVGWFDAWGDKKHHIEKPAPQAANLDDILAGGSVNIYVVHGGTNFGFMNGANYYNNLTPDVTSYDYDALITEDGSITPKYRAFRKVISKYNPIPKVIFSTEIRKRAYAPAKLVSSVRLFDCLDTISTPTYCKFPLSMEKLGQSYGYIMYRAALNEQSEIGKIRLFETADRAKIYLDEEELLTLYDVELQNEHKLLTKVKGSDLSILVENMGRVNYGYKMDSQWKGIHGAVTLNGHHHYGWNEYPLPLDNVDMIPFSDNAELFSDAAFYKFDFEADEKADTFIDMSGFGKGCVFINGFNLGRFWEIGPQVTLYIPGPLIKEGKNEIVVFETEGKAEKVLEFSEKAILCKK